MKKNQIELIKNEITNLLNFYKYETLENNYKKLNNELNIINNNIESLHNERNEKKETFKNSNGLYQLVNNPEWAQFKEENNAKKEIETKKQEVLKISIEAYTNIINNILHEILIKILHLYLKNVITYRDHNDFIKIFAYNETEKKYPYLIRLYYESSYLNRFSLCSVKYYNNFETTQYLKYYISMNNNIIFENQNELESIKNYTFKDFEIYSKEKNIFDINQIKKDIKKFIDLSNKEYLKIQKQIESSKNTVNNINYYSIRYFNNLFK